MPKSNKIKKILYPGERKYANFKKKFKKTIEIPKNILEELNKLSPNSKVYFQSLLPLPIKNNHDWETNAVICDFNLMLYDNCCYWRCYYIDAYGPFSNPRRWGVPDTRREKLFESEYGIHPRVGRGMGTLARLYMRALHSQYFDPCIFQ